jgi:GxxExxY protein
MSDILKLCDVIRETGYAIHRYLGPGHFESVYEKALLHRLAKQGLLVRPKFPIPVFDEDGTPLGDYEADLLVDDELIIEVKAANTFADAHVAQILGYLRATRREHGLLINFGAPKFQIKKYILDAYPLGGHDGSNLNRQLME